jgi:peptidoglycan hydrolase-like amidase
MWCCSKELYSEKIEAMKAQAVLPGLMPWQSWQTQRRRFDLCSGEHCQFYGGLEAENLCPIKLYGDAGVILSL